MKTNALSTARIKLETSTKRLQRLNKQQEEDRRPIVRKDGPRFAKE